MSFVHKIDETPQQESGGQTFNHQGWGSTQGYSKYNRIKNISDKLTGNARNALEFVSKAGSSIPSIFARLHLFETALKIVSQNRNPTEAHPITPYHILVSHCFDLLELLFQEGNTSNLTYKVWSRARLNSLQKGSKAHKNLADAIELDLSKGLLNDVHEITLIYYKGILVGGTSPLSLVFTSPNWKSSTPIKNQNGDRYLFQNEYVPLNRRNPDFYSYMYNYYLEHIRSSRSQDWSLKEFFNAEFGDNIKVPTLLNTRHDIINIPSTVPNGASSELRITIDLPLYVVKPDDLSETSDFLIDKTHYAGKKPLVLKSGMQETGIYFKTTQWRSSCTIDRDDFNEIPLNDRHLPCVANMVYPYITTEDFLCDELIKISDTSNIDNTKFFTGTKVNQDSNFLLPIKIKYFDFFTIDQLKEYLEVNIDDLIVTVRLKVPIKNGRFIIFTKIYKVKHTAIMDLAISPFYQMENNENLNQYDVMLTGSDNKLNSDTKFYKVVNNKIDEVETTGVQRTLNPVASHFFKINNNHFDIIEIGSSDKKGLVIPNFDIKELGTKAFSFAIDFGTTNTHIVYSKDRGDLNSFSFNEEDSQTANLLIGKTSTQFSREFTPTTFGGGDDSFNTPFRTVLYEKEGQNYTEILSGANIGFNLDKEKGDHKGNQYITNLKWVFEGNPDNPHPQTQVRMFFEHLFLMFKHKVLMNSGSLEKVAIAWLQPKSMDTEVSGKIGLQLAQAFENIFKRDLPKEYETPITESLAPYYDFVKRDQPVYQHENLINIDIGGGTTDVLFVYPPNNGEKITLFNTSFKFAGNDIWGDIQGDSKNNVFLSNYNKYFEANKARLVTNLNKKNNNLISIYEFALKDKELSSEDVISLLFKHKEFNFIDSVDANKETKLILFIHYCAIIYHISKIIELKNLDIPRYLTFTGRGSEYIKRINIDVKSINILTKSLLEIYTSKKPCDDFEIKFDDNPKEITAKGALFYRNADINEQERYKNIEYINLILNEFSANEDHTHSFKDLQDKYKINEDLFTNLNDFFNLTFSNSVVKNFLVTKLGIENYHDKMSFFYHKKDDGRIVLNDKIKGDIGQIIFSLQNNPDKPVRETLFFKPFKKMLNEFGKSLVAK